MNTLTIENSSKSRYVKKAPVKWKAIPGFEHYYIAYTDGRIQNVIKGKFLKFTTAKKTGYQHVALALDGKNHHFAAQKLIALTFIPNPENLPQVYHIDGDRSNNSVQNLRWSEFEYQESIYQVSIETDGEEIWKPVLGYEGIYEVSNHCRVRSVSRVVLRRNRSGVNTTFFVNARIKQPTLQEIGYWIVRLTKNNIGVNTLLHRMVAEAFIPNPENKPQVNHKNGNKADCSLSNLEWVTASENVRHAFDVLKIVPGHKGKSSKGSTRRV